MKRETHFAGFLFAAVILLFLPVPASGLGIGIAPTDIEINSAMRGAEYERALTVLNPGEPTNNFTLSVDGYAADWIRIYKTVNTSEPVGEIAVDANGRGALIVKIRVPNDAPTGNYNATIYVKTTPQTSNETGLVSAVLMATTRINIELIGDQIIDGKVSAVAIEENAEPGYPLRIGITFKNTGNVITGPEISVNILKDGSAVSSFTQAGAAIKPEATETIIAEWNTTSAESVGDYLANVGVSLEGRELASSSIPFKVLPVGTLSRQGVLTDIVIEDEPLVGSAVMVTAYFKNTGRIDTLAKFSGEVYLNGVRTDFISSDELLVEKGLEMPLVSYLKLQSPGNYRVTGRVVYSGKETETRDVIFNVPENANPTSAESANENMAAISTETVQSWLMPVTGMVAGIESKQVTVAVGVLTIALVALLLRRRMR